MRFASIGELRSRAAELVRSAREGTPVVITSGGRPAALLVSASEDDLEDWVLAHSPALRAELDQLEAEAKAGDATPAEDLVRRRAAT